MKNKIKALLGKKLINTLRPPYGAVKALYYSWVYSRPAKDLILIGITGTKGKTSTTVLTGRLLDKLGIKVGYISTSVINTGKGELENQYKMSNLDSKTTNRLLNEMKENGCEVVVMETTSQGLHQRRHIGLGKYYIAAFLNLYADHIEDHGGFEQYKKAKSILFKNIQKNGIFLGNENSEYTDFMQSVIVNESIQRFLVNSSDSFEIATSSDKIHKKMIFSHSEYVTNFFAAFEIHNLWFAITISSQLIANKYPNKGIKLQDIIKQASKLEGIPGRMEFVHQSKTLDIMVDYAHEVESLKQLLESLSDWRKEKVYDNIIHVISSDGVGRDDWKKPVMGKLSYDLADYTVITTDNFSAQDDPQEIVNTIAQDIEYKKGKKTKFVKIVDRQEAFKKAIDKSKKMKGKTIIVSTGVGNEFGLTQPGGVMKWSEKAKWQELVKLK